MSTQSMSLQDELTGMLKQFQAVPKPDALVKLLGILRHEMEVPATPSSGPSGFRTGQAAASSSSNAAGGGGSGGGGGGGGSSGGSMRSFGSSSASNSGSSSVPVWRSGVSSMKKISSNETFQTIHKSNSNSSLASTGKSPRTPASGPLTPTTSSTGVTGRYQSRFVSKGNIEEKILNTIIGNKLNAFTVSTYNDTRDFIYQILDTGEIEFIKDFVEKVFMKATVEDLYCAHFAKLLSEIAHSYPVIYEEMNRYHAEFLHVFDDVQEGSTNEASIKKRQYRMGYGQFISELASLNALPKEHLLSIIQKICEAIHELTSKEDKSKVVEEYTDCLIRLTTNLRETSPTFYASVRGDMQKSVVPVISPLVDKLGGTHPSLSSKARYGLMDLRDMLC